MKNNLLLQELCRRLPYYIEVEYCGDNYELLGISHGRCILCKKFSSKVLDICPLVEEVKPYLFPLSSMTEEQYDEFTDMGYSVTENWWSMANYHQIEWLDKNCFDYKGLIPSGQAIDATGLNIY